MTVATVPTNNASLQTGFYPLQDPRACCRLTPWTESIENDLNLFNYTGSPLHHCWEHAYVMNHWSQRFSLQLRVARNRHAESVGEQTKKEKFKVSVFGSNNEAAKKRSETTASDWVPVYGSGSRAGVEIERTIHWPAQTDKGPDALNTVSDPITLLKTTDVAYHRYYFLVQLVENDHAFDDLGPHGRLAPDAKECSEEDKKKGCYQSLHRSICEVNKRFQIRKACKGKDNMITGPCYEDLLHSECCAYDKLKADKSTGSLMPIEKTPESFEFHYVNFTLAYRNPAFSKFELGFKYAFIVLAVFTLAIFWSACEGDAAWGTVSKWFCLGLLLNVFLFVAMFVYTLAFPGRCCGDSAVGRKSVCATAPAKRRRTERTFEQMYVTALLVCLIGYNNPFYALTYMFPGRIAYFAVVGNVLLAFLFVAALLVWWLAVFDSLVADPPFSFVRFYLPKIAFAVVFFCVASGIYGSVTLKQIHDPFYDWAEDDAVWRFVKAFIGVWGGLYMLWIYYLLMRGAEAIGVPVYAFVALLLGVGVFYPGFYQDKHTFMYMFHVCVMYCCVVGVCAGAVFQAEVGSATDFLFFHALLNCYVGALAYLYLPAHGGMLVQDEDERTAMARAPEGEGDGDGEAQFEIGGYHDDDDVHGGGGDDRDRAGDFAIREDGVELTEIEVIAGARAGAPGEEEATLSSGSEDDGKGVGGGRLTSMAELRKRLSGRGKKNKKKGGGKKNAKKREEEAAPPGSINKEEEDDEEVYDDEQIVEL